MEESLQLLTNKVHKLEDDFVEEKKERSRQMDVSTILVFGCCKNRKRFCRLFVSHFSLDFNPSTCTQDISTTRNLRDNVLL